MSKPGKSPAKLPQGNARPPGLGQKGTVLSKDRLDRVLAICDRVANGAKITELLGPNRPEGWPTWKTFAGWQAEFPAVRDMYRTARELSAQALEDKALGIAEGLVQTGAEYTGVFVQGAGKAMEQFRWSAERRSPGDFGTKATQQTVVPIQINTTLDLGQPGGGATVDAGNPFSYVVEVGGGTQQGQTAPSESVDVPEVAEDPRRPNAALPGLPALTAQLPPEAERFGLTEWPVSVAKRRTAGARKLRGNDPKTGEPYPVGTSRSGRRTAEGYAKERIAELKRKVASEPPARRITPRGPYRKSKPDGPLEV
jgi:hypothetical protein